MLRAALKTNTQTLSRLSIPPRTPLTLTRTRLFTNTALRAFEHNNNDPKPPQKQQEAGLRQKAVPIAGANEDADSAISGFMNMFNDKEARTVSITTCTKHGFVTTEAITLQGPVLCIGGQVFLWDIYKENGAVDRALKKNNKIASPPTVAAAATSTSTASAASPSQQQQPARSIFETMDESTAKEIFKVFELMNPRPEILIVGTGKAFAPLSPAVRSVVRSLGLQVDMMSTANAAATYNMLAEEGREVAAALLPLEPSTAQIIRNNRQ
ncbi:hypothetical protein BGX33_008732 [Mortierella sp. NVP41]|nr:hypothetical protein BGX33_008732 [Mortierella sp. NVP41]